MAIKKKNKKSNIDLRLFIFRNIKKTFKYYIKSFLYILFVNVALFYILSYLLRIQYTHFILKYFSNPNLFKIAYYGIFLVLFYILKVILYGNVINTMKSNGKNDIKDLFVIVIKRYLSVFGTFLIYLAAVAFYSLLLIIPGILFFFYYYFAIFLCAVGDMNKKENNKIKLLNSGKALGRSYTLVKGNLIRFMITTLLIVAIIYFIDKGVMYLIVKFNFDLNSQVYNMIRLCIWDIFIIYSSLIFIKFQRIENDLLEDEFRNNQQEQIMMMQAAISNLNKAKRPT